MITGGRKAYRDVLSINYRIMNCRLLSVGFLRFLYLGDGAGTLSNDRVSTKLKHPTFLSDGRQPEVSCFPI